MNCDILLGHWIDRLREMPDESVQCCTTSPPYWGLRSYLKPGDPLKRFELGSEKTPEEYIAKIVEGFREVKRVLKRDGTLWLNLGDLYRGKNLVGIPWRVAFALQADGWCLRSEIIWHKPNPMPESVTDRPTKAHEYIFLLTKSERYYYDHRAIKEPVAQSQIGRVRNDLVGGVSHLERGQHSKGGSYRGSSFTKEKSRVNGNGRNQPDAERKDPYGLSDTRNKRSVWSVPTSPYPKAHFATFPPNLIRPCILAGSRAGDTILDPFGGSGTTGQVAMELGRNVILIELNREYIELINQRTGRAQPLVTL